MERQRSGRNALLRPLRTHRASGRTGAGERDSARGELRERPPRTAHRDPRGDPGDRREGVEATDPVYQ